MSEGKCNTRRVSTLDTSSLEMVPSTLHARQSASDGGVYCRSVDSLGSGQSLAYDLFLMDMVVHVCGNRLDGRGRIEHGD